PEAEDNLKISSTNSEASLLLRAASEGKSILEDGSDYEGEMIRGLPHGYGKRKFTNEDFFEGQFVDGQAHGHGTLRYKSDPNLEKYVGMWANGLREGYGTLYFSDTSQMVGHWKDNSLFYGEFRMSKPWQKEHWMMDLGINFLVSLVKLVGMRLAPLRARMVTNTQAASKIILTMAVVFCLVLMVPSMWGNFQRESFQVWGCCFYKLVRDTPVNLSRINPTDSVFKPM
ncbi:MAG: hypothetical protein VW775_01525, partial [Schleiferiaceae bacterium]